MAGLQPDCTKTSKEKRGPYGKNRGLGTGRRAFLPARHPDSGEGSNRHREDLAQGSPKIEVELHAPSPLLRYPAGKIHYLVCFVPNTPIIAALRFGV